MYMSNATAQPKNSRLRSAPLSRLIQENDRQGERLVHMGAYALMPNHFHFVLQETEDKGIARFMQKLLTGYTMYFNKRYERSGPLFSGVFKSKHVDDDRYFRHLISYVHLNPAVLIDKTWKFGKAKTRRISDRLPQYAHSSLPDFIDGQHHRPERSILSNEVFDAYDFPGITEIVREANAYYRENVLERI
jgi:hypothetical protein